MKDQTTLLYFREARRLLHNDGMGMFTKQLGLFREVTSIVARMAALLSLTNDKSWHILSIVACYPLFERFIEMLPIFSRQTCMPRDLTILTTRSKAPRKNASSPHGV